MTTAALALPRIATGGPRRREREEPEGPSVWEILEANADFGAFLRFLERLGWPG